MSISIFEEEGKLRRGFLTAMEYKGEVLRRLCDTEELQNPRMMTGGVYSILSRKRTVYDLPNL